MTIKRTHFDSPFGIARFAWITKPDTKYNVDGRYTCDLVVGGAEGQALKDKITAAATEELANFWLTERGKKVAPKDRAKWSIYTPFEEDLDDEGNPTGYVIFHFKQNAKIKLRDGSVKGIKISVYDATGEREIKRPVFSSSELRINYYFRENIQETAKKVGVQLAFSWVQVRALANPERGPRFSAVEGYQEPDEAPESDASTGGTGPADTSAPSGDY